MAIITIQGERGPEKWNMRIFGRTTPLRFTVAQLRAFPENRSFLSGAARDAVVEIIRIDPTVIRERGLRGSIEYRWTSSTGSGSGGRSIWGPVSSAGRTWQEVHMRIPGYIEPIRATGTSVTKVEVGPAMNPVIWVGAAAVAAVAAFFFMRRT